MKIIEKNIGIVFVILVVVSLLLPWLLTEPAFHNRFIFNGEDGTGQIGDTIGGTMGPFIAIIGALLTYFVFRSQTKFEEWQAFESKFYKMLDYHRQNVSEMYIGVKAESRFPEIKSVKCFEEMTKELELIYAIGEHFEKEYVSKLSTEAQTEFSYKKYGLYYLTFHYGINMGYDDEVLDHSGILSQEIMNTYHGFLLAIKQVFLREPSVSLLSLTSLSFFNYRRTCSKETIILLYNSMDEYLRLRIKQDTHIPILEGNLTHLNHYFVNLFNIFKMIELEIPNSEYKSKYYGIVKSQLTAYEIVILYYNCHAPYGEKWYYHPEKDELSPNDNYITRTNLFEHLIPRFAMQNNIIRHMKQETVTEIRQRSILMNAFKRAKISYLKEFYKRNRHSVICACAIALVLWVIEIALVFCIYDGTSKLDYYFHNLFYSVLGLSIISIPLLGWMRYYITKNKQSIIGEYGFNPSEVSDLRQVSYLRFKKELYSIGYLTGEKETDASLLSLYISWVVPVPGISMIQSILAGFSTIVAIWATKDVVTMLLTLIGLMIAFAIIRVVNDMAQIWQQNKLTAFEFLQSLYAENQISDRD